ncbi:hypothetical protein K493DRAFT_9394 [Basidiobolus meristosporus CBS 931.73]|uniref:DUF6787 domain-containing protein n=1 Tax=Basidiobolus meristosporus CBS 931.73 TaxID=1314790 RepID=A0A1Y1Z9Y3_9FUNG|nr:hypothetical protein K493DRAFT_9394 [Basidiobolus meristosporus CBS 931.73]|eukprot:ORY06976.1 hypothetical protein K493DRAFT_9394 [Basidiobolus meristosporus CBS 931.73]
MDQNATTRHPVPEDSARSQEFVENNSINRIPKKNNKGIIILVFVLTSLTNSRLTRAFLAKALKLKGSLLGGPWIYRLAYVLVTLHLYPFVILFWGSLFNHRSYFAQVVLKRYGKILPNSIKAKLLAL